MTPDSMISLHASNSNISRRDILRYGATAAGGLAVLSLVPLKARHAHAYEAEDSDQPDPAFSPYVEIRPTGDIHIVCPNSEMGQGVNTSISMLVAEELDCDWARVSVSAMNLHLTMRDGRLAYKYAPQGAGGSTSITDGWVVMRQAGATARMLLVEAAARRWSVDAASLKTEASFVIDERGNRRIAYADLVSDAAEVELPEAFEPQLKKREEWRLIGKPQHHKGVEDIIRGKPLYGIDASYPNMKIAVIARSHYLDGEVKTVDDTAARAVPGVVDIVTLKRPDMDKNYTYLAAGVAVVADSFWTAKKARDLLKIEWDRGPYTDESSDSFARHCDALMATKGAVVRKDGDVASATASAAKVVRRQYRMPFVSHAQLEPQNAIAHVEADRCTIIGPFQSPAGASRHGANLTGIDRLKVHVEVTRLGGGFGRRLTSDHAAEAVTISKATGLPIKVMWTREDDLCHDFYRPAGLHEMVAALDGDGEILSWQHRLASASKYYRRDNVPEEDMWTPELYADDFPAGLITNYELEYFAAKSGMPRGSWRAPAHTVNAFVTNTFIDEIAEETGQDFLALWLKMLGPAKEIPYGQHGGPVFDTGRLATVLKTAAENAGWGRAIPDGRGLGLAGHFTFGGYMAHAAEIERTGDNTFRVVKVWSAVDVGTVVNPAGVIAQAEGGVQDGLSTFLGQQILVEGGRVMNDNFDRYHMMRMAESVPEIETTIIKSDKDPSGMGEMSIPPLAPAVANALRRAGWPRVRNHPLRTA